MSMKNNTDPIKQLEQSEIKNKKLKKIRVELVTLGRLVQTEWKVEQREKGVEFVLLVGQSQREKITSERDLGKI